MSIRQYDLDVTVQTSNLPGDGGTPTLDGHIVTLGFATDTYTPKADVYGSVPDISDAKAIASADRFDDQVLWISSKETFYEFDSASSASNDDDLVLQPTVGTGRWIKKLTGTGGSGSGAAGIESLEQKLENEHYDIVTDPLKNSIGSSFHAPAPVIVGRLLADYASGTTAHVCWNPLYINDADKNTDSATGWAAQGDAGVLTTSGTAKIGSTSLSFEKDGGAATNARIRYDRGSADLNINGYTELFFWINLPSLVNLVDVEVRIDVDSTNYQTYNATLDHTGAALVTGWQLMKFDLTTAGTTSGTGWDKSKYFRYLHIGVNTSSAAQIYTAILVDSIHFSVHKPLQLAQIGNVYTIANTSTIAEFQIDSTSARSAGEIVLGAALGAAYAGGTSSSVKRSTLVIAGDNRAVMENGLSGAAADTQVVRLQRMLPVTIAGANFDITNVVNTPLFFEVTEVTDSDTIKVDDPADSTANLTSGTVFHILRVDYDADGVANYSDRIIDQTISSSSHLAGVTTLNTSTTNTGVIVGDLVLVKSVATRLSLVDKAAEENFQSPSFTQLIVDNLGINYFGNTTVAAHYPLSGSQGYKNKKGTLQDLTLVGSLTTNDVFKNGEFATSGFADANYYEITAANSDSISGTTADSGAMFISFWAYLTPDTGATRVILGRQSTGSAAGWDFRTDSPSNNMLFRIDSVNLSGAFTPNAWSHIAGQLDNGVSGGTKLWINGVLVDTDTLTASDSGEQFRIGRGVAASIFANGIKLSQVLIVRQKIATQSEVETIYNRGLGRVLAAAPGPKYRHTLNGVSGNKLSQETTLSRVTDAATLYLSKSGAIKK